jgi:hypothetical protein
MAASFNPFKNSFQSAYLDVTDNSKKSPFGFTETGETRSQILSAMTDPISGSTNANTGPTNINAGMSAPKLSSFESTQNYMDGLFGGPPSSNLSTSVGLSGVSSTPLGNGSAQNSTQNAQKQQSSLQQAFNSVQALYSPMGGRPIGGSEDVRVKADAYGRPYTVVSMTPTDERGVSQKQETMSFGISPEQKASASPQVGEPQGGMVAGSKPSTVGNIGATEKFTPFADQNKAQMEEYNRRKQSAMSGQYGTSLI